ncbi:hypothetical protein SEA_BLUENGOLD_7 [Gordonia phage BlueNGold]|nr:hypothetical protein SEA_BLUENGOLD_7 [Gordonia phage BlueNGold]WBF03789.1 hypothetical protein SEA_MAREELIH_6 [Gordonia phage Mareelih]
MTAHDDDAFDHTWNQFSAELGRIERARERDPLYQVRQDLKIAQKLPLYQNNSLARVGVNVKDLEILLAEHDELSTMQNYNTSCRECAKRIDREYDKYVQMDQEAFDMDQYEYEMVREGWGWQ